ncbi:MAG: hypothetical protein J6X97_10230 [Lachnospiraceae bacterium]|nr:hypothetical protein [Lachnospiraceae bacterium]
MIEQYVNEIYEALNHKFYYPALALTLALPDICGMAEYPNEDVGKRYINWIDKYLGEYFNGKEGECETDAPCLTGEVIYNLRNTFLHQGSPNVQKEKIKKESNQVDKFTIILGDATRLWMCSRHIDSPVENINYREMTVEIYYLCDSICSCALWYYQHNKDKFKFDINVVSQEDYLSPYKDEQKE